MNTSLTSQHTCVTFKMRLKSWNREHWELLVLTLDSRVNIWSEEVHRKNVKVQDFKFLFSAFPLLITREKIFIKLSTWQELHSWLLYLLDGIKSISTAFVKRTIWRCNSHPACRTLDLHLQPYKKERAGKLMAVRIARSCILWFFSI